MNDDLKTRHLESMTDPGAINMYNTLCRACELREGGMTDADQMLVCDVSRLEEIKGQLIADIRKRGIGEERYNGRQRYYQENKSVAQLRACAEQQRKHLAELRLTPNARKAPGAELPNDDFSRF